NRLSILDNQIAFYQRNPTSDLNLYSGYRVSVILDKDRFLYVDSPDNHKPPKYDIRTTKDFLFAIGFNNTIIEGQSLDDSPYQLGGSGFVELGWLWKTRLLENSNFARVTYGLSVQWNKLSIKDNQYFVANDNETTLETFPLHL